jgi:hypothetical protein
MGDVGTATLETGVGQPASDFGFQRADTGFEARTHLTNTSAG